MSNFRRSFSFPMPYTPQVKLMSKAVHQTTPKSLSPHSVLQAAALPGFIFPVSSFLHVVSNLKQTSGDQFCFTV